MFYNLRYSNHVLNNTKVKVRIAYCNHSYYVLYLAMLQPCTIIYYSAIAVIDSLCSILS